MGNQRRLYGVDAVMRNMNEWLDTWDEHRIDLEEVIEQGDSVVASIHITARGKAKRGRDRRSPLRSVQGAEPPDRLRR